MKKTALLFGVCAQFALESYVSASLFDHNRDRVVQAKEVVPAEKKAEASAEKKEDTAVTVTTKFEAKNFTSLFGMKGFSDSLLSLHLKLYEGYVNNANILSEKLHALSTEGKDRTPEYAGLKRMYGWEFDGMRLHEYYFGNLGGKGTPDVNSNLYRLITQEFGSFDKWKQDFIATGMIRGIGWSILYFDNQTNRLTNAWINEHDLGHLAGARPLVVMDVFEHAYIPDYGLDRNKYIQAFFENLDWDVVNKRFEKN